MFQENDIRPLNGKEKQKIYKQEDINFLQSMKNDFIDINCPTCNTRNRQVELTKDNFNFVKCSYCSMLYMNPRPDSTILGKYYSNSKNHQFFATYIYPQSKEIRREKIFIPRVKSIIEYCKKFQVKRDSILEIGPGFGIFLEEIVKKDFFKNVYGVEPSSTLLEHAKEKGFKAYNGIFEDTQFDTQFDVIVSFEVIEHIANPKKLLEKAFSSLNSNGLLMMTFPNYNGFDIGVLKEKSDSICHTHLNYFNEKSITLLLEDIGFEMVQVTTPGVLDIDLVRNKILKESIKTNMFIEDLCVNKSTQVRESFQNFLIENNLSSNMMIIAKKL